MTQGTGGQEATPSAPSQGPINQPDQNNDQQQQQANGAHQHHQQHHHQHHQQQRGHNSLQPIGHAGGRGGGRGPRVVFPTPVADVGDGKIVLLFDLNGVLTEKTPPRLEGKWLKRDHIVRPHIEELLRLYPHFRIGVFSSATVRTVNTALDTLYAALQRSAAQRGIDGLLLPKKYDLFNVIYYRDHCQPDPYWSSREDGKDHDTIKPLARLGFDLNRTVLVDNDDYKAADGEHENMLHVPHWEQTEETNRDFPLMIQLILRHLKGIKGDVRPHLRLIERQLRQLRSTDASRLQTAADRARTRAVTAATAAKWAGDDSIRQALAAEEVPQLDGVSAAWLPEEVQLTPQMQQKLRQFALQGFKANSAADLAAAPPAATQLVDLLSKHRAESAAAAAAVDVQQLLADATEEVKEAHTQHALVLLLAAAWGCNITAPAGTFTLGQLSDLLKSRGWPTDHLAAAVEAMIWGGTIKVHGQEQQQQQQQQQQRWAWPEPPGYWPSPAVQLPATAGGTVQPPPSRQQQQQQPQQSPAWNNCFLLLPELRVNKLMKSVADVTSFLATTTPAAVTDVVRTMEYNCRMATAPEGQRDQLQQQRQQQLAGKSPDERNRLTSLAYAWSTVIHAAVRDVAAMHGVTAQQLLCFIKGLNPTLQQQLLGSDSSSEQQQLQQLQELLQQLKRAAKSVPVRMKDKRQKALLCAPFGVFTANPLGIFRQQTGGNAAKGIHADPAAAAALTTYAVGVVPNAEAVARSIRVLEAAAGAADVAAVAAAVDAARVEQQQQLDRHVAQQGGSAQHSVLQQQKPPVTACLTLSPHLSLPAVVVQWPMQFEQAKQQLQQQPSAAPAAAGAAEGRQDGKRQREATDGAAAAAAGGFRSSAPIAAAAGESAALDGGSASKKQKRDGAAAAAAGGISRSSSQEDAAAEAADHEADLDALYDREEQQRQQYEAEMAALEAEEEAVAAAELAAIDAAGVAGFQRGTSSAAAAAAAEGSDIELLLPDVDEESEEGLGQGEQEGLGDEGDQGLDDDNDRNDDDDDDMRFDGAAGAADGAGSGSDGGGGQAGSQGGYSEDGDGGADGMGSDRGEPGSGSDEQESEQDGPDSGPDSDGPNEDDGFNCGDDGEEEYLLDTEDREGESGGAFEGELGSEDDSDVWATDDEADGQLQLGITGLEDSAVEADIAAAAAEDAVADAAAAETAAAMQRASAAATAAGRQVRGRLPLYVKLQAALSAARGSAAAAAAAGWCCRQQQQQQQPSRLHFELLQFAAAAAPCAVELLFVEKALQQLQGAANITWPNNEPEALLFGSQATGLALPGSDLDVVLLRVPGCPTPSKTDKGFGLKDKQRVASLLGSFAKCLRSEGYASKKGLQVVIAKVPILKGALFVHMPQSELLAALATDNPAAAQQLAAAAAAAAAGGASQNGKRERVLTVEMQVDISIGIADSSAAVNYVQRQVRTFGPMRPLLLAAKAVLREAGLNEVFTGGLGSYALALLVISHLQAEGVADLATSAMLPSDLSNISHQPTVPEHLQRLSAAAAAAAAAVVAAGSSGGSPQQQQQWDLGLLLQGFFLRFGALYDYKAEAVVVNQGGVLTKPRQWVQDKRPFLLSVEDPAMPGRDMSSGSYAIREVKSAFTRAAGILRELTTKFEGTDTSNNRQPTAAAAAAGGVSLQERVAAAVAAAVLAAPGSNAQPPQQQQLQQQQAFAVVEDRDAWAAVQADGASQSVGNNVKNNVAPAASRGGGSSSPVAGGLAAVAGSREQQLTQGLKQGLGMMSQLMDVAAALGRGAGADAHRSEQARRAALRRQARLTAQKLQYGQQLGTISAVQQQQQQQQQQAPAQLSSKVRRKLARAEKQQEKRKAQGKPLKPLKVKVTKKQHQQQQIQQKRQANIMSLYARQQQQQQQGGQPQQGQQRQQGGGRRRPLTRGQLRVQQQKRTANQQQPHQGQAQQRQQQQGQQQRRVPAKRQRAQQQQQQQGRKRARDGGASGGGGGRGWVYE